MTWTLPNGTTPDQQIAQVASQSDVIGGALLAFIYLVFFVTIHFGHRSSTGKSSIGSSLVFAGIITTICSFILILIGGIINMEVVYICMSVTIGSIIYFFLSND